jgi:uncharacterized membrane protein
MNDSNLRFLLYILSFQALVCASILFDIQFVRQVLGFIFIAFIPGFLLLKAFRIERPHLAETIVLSVGLSLALLMVIGFLLNELGTLTILTAPLATEPLVIVINIIVVGLCAISFLTNKEYSRLDPKSWGKFWRYLPFFLLPVLSVIGVLFISYFQINLVSILVVAFIALFFVVSAFRPKLSSYYPLILFSIVLAILLSSALMSNYMYGDDIQVEFRTFLETKNAMYWNPQNYSTIQQSSDNSMLSITILPTIISNVLNIEPSLVFKIVFPIIFSLVPLGLYELYRRQFTEKVAFISVIFLIANFYFFTQLLTNSKQMIGELFYVILFLELLSKSGESHRSNWIILVLALFGLIVSHYSLDFIFILFILFTWLGGQLFFKRTIKKISASFIVFTSCLVFFWYIYVTSAGPFDKFVGVTKRTINSFMTEFFSSSSRGEDVQTALGITARPSMLHTVGTILYDITILLILIGFIALILKWRKRETSCDFRLLAGLNIILLIAAVLLPRFAGFLELGRLYQILLMFLSPLFVIGCEALFTSLLAKVKNKKTIDLKDEKIRTTISLVLTFIILVAFFLFQTGLVYEITNDPAPSSFSLSYYRMQNSPILIHESDVFSAQWLSKYGDITHMPTYSDSVSIGHVLTSYSTIDLGMIFLLSNTSGIFRHPDLISNVMPTVANTSYIYLRQYNVLNGIINWDTRENIWYNVSELPILNNTGVFINKIYSNSDSEIYFRSP